ncbi:MAG: hypothetical protein ACI379_16515 [Nocardioides sp.]|uniref:WXG100 family type VII secretion target n=1 Tax=Nocardioides sp. TaxID=35761 RepID=UPI003F0176B3
MYGDTAVIRGLATQMDDQAKEIRSEADGLVRSSEQVLWEGRAAEAMRQRMKERAVSLRETATEHEDAAQALRSHADNVDRLKALIDSIARKVQGLIEGAKSRLASLAQTAVDKLTDVLPDPFDDFLARFTPPPPGHKDWLDVPDQIPGAGR